MTTPAPHEIDIRNPSDLTNYGATMHTLCASEAAAAAALVKRLPLRAARWMEDGGVRDRLADNLSGQLRAALADLANSQELAARAGQRVAEISEAIDGARKAARSIRA